MSLISQPFPSKIPDIQRHLDSTNMPLEELESKRKQKKDLRGVNYNQSVFYETLEELVNI